MSQEKLQTMVMQKFWGLIEVHYGIVQVVNFPRRGDVKYITWGVTYFAHARWKIKWLLAVVSLGKRTRNQLLSGHFQ